MPWDVPEHVSKLGIDRDDAPLIVFGLGQRNRPLAQIDIRPSKGEYLPPPQAGVHRHERDRLQMRSAGIEYSRQLLGRQIP